MKINPITRTGAVNPYQNQDTKATQSNRSKGRRKDEVQISAEAKQMLGAINQAQGKGAVSSVPAAKLQELKEQVSTGTYYVEANKIAEKMLPYFKK